MLCGWKEKNLAEDTLCIDLQQAPVMICGCKRPKLRENYHPNWRTLMKIHKSVLGKMWHIKAGRAVQVVKRDFYRRMRRIMKIQEAEVKNDNGRRRTNHRKCGTAVAGWRGGKLRKEG